MDHIGRYLLFFAKFLVILRVVSSDTYTVRIGTDRYVNEVDSRFLSFTVDPKYLFSSSEKYNNKESICMASSLTPAYIRIAGPSTSHMTFHNSSITFTDLDLEQSRDSKQKDLAEDQELRITNTQWKKFIQWAEATGFDLVFALNNEEKMESGLWDPNTALNILTMAEKADVGDIFWQLGYECRNQSIEDYLNDLETLRVITETFPPGEAREWRVVGGDVTGCLQAHSKSDFKDYVTLSEDLMDAVLLHGNSSAQELDRMSDSDRMKLLKLLSQSTTPLWLTESPQLPDLKTPGSQKTPGSPAELHRAADWMTSLGYSARNGFAVNFRELAEDELYEPTLSFYMALLYKNLVGERVLDVDMEASQAVLFAHCTSLRHKPVSGAVTLYGANLDDEPARFSVKLSRREDGGDILQFILGHDPSGNIIVNGRAMYYEGDMRPVVKRVRPYKTLLLNLPPRSFGFWVLANTNIEACHNIDDNNAKNDTIEVISAFNEQDEADESNTIKTKRSMNLNDGNIEELDKLDEIVEENDVELIENEGLKKGIDNLDKDLTNVCSLLETNSKKNKDTVLNRLKRQTNNQDNEKRKLRKHVLKTGKEKTKSDETVPRLQLFRKLFGTNSKANNTRQSRIERARKFIRVNKNKVKRNSVHVKAKPIRKLEENITNVEEKETRKRRSVNEKQTLSRNVKEDNSSENEIDSNKEQVKLWKILHKIHEQIKELPEEDPEYVDYGNEAKDDEIVLKTKVSDDSTIVNYSETSKKGLVKSAVANVVNVLSDLNKNLNKFWNTLNILE